MEAEGQIQQPEPQAAQPTEGKQAPPWGENFDPERAWGLITKLRDEVKGAKPFIEAGISLDDAKTAIEERDKLRAAQMSEQEKLQAELSTWQQKAEKAAERESAAVRRALTAEVSTQAKDKFADADVAIKLLGDVTGFASDNGVDADRLGQAFDDLLAKYPYLARSGGEAPRMKPNPAQGTSGAGAISLDAEIHAAQKAGDFGRSIALKQMKAAQARQ